MIRNCVSSGAVLDKYESFKASIAAYSSCLMRKEENVLSSVGLSSNFWMWNGSYIRLKNVELGYTLPQRITQKANIKQLRIYANLYNCLTFSSQKFFDPEQLESQYSFASYPQIMSFNVGINLKF